MLHKLKNNVFKFYFTQFGSYVYLIKLKDKNILIDTGSKLNKKELKKDLEELNIHLSEINIIILTHAHWDHTGNISIFPNAKVYASKKLSKSKKLIDIDKLKIRGIKIIETPGHSIDSICILYKEFLFSGDTLFHRGTTGRTDLPTSSQKEMDKSIEKLSDTNYEILCPSHGRE